tara:strand:- start:16528 stop:17466 length:939 start_codon:yes stop_codon:yes gene_type:complete
MKKFLVKIVSFLLICSLIYCSVIYSVGNSIEGQSAFNIQYMRGSSGHTYSRLEDAKVVRDLDILFIGTSLTFRGYDTRIFDQEGIKSFNLGTAGETPQQSEYLLKKHLKNISPKLVIYEINPEWFGNNGSGSAIDIISNMKFLDLASLRMAVITHDIQVFNTYVYSLMTSILDNENYLELNEKNGQIYIKNGGFVESPLKMYHPESFGIKRLKIKDQQLSAFERSLNFLKDKNISVILVRPPITQTLYTSFSNNNKIDKLFSSYGEYYNFNKRIKLNDSLHFSDARHLNQDGVITYNNFFIEFLKKEKIIYN